MGLDASITVNKYGYYPKGMGEVTLAEKPCHELKPFRLENFGNIKSVKGLSVCTFLTDKKVAQRQADAANKYLTARGYRAEIQVLNDTSNPLQKGSSIVLWAETDTGAVLGADAIGELGKMSETVGFEAAEKFYSEVSAKPTIDVHLSDMLIPYVALAEGSSVFLTKRLSGHLETNIWLAEKMLGVKFKVERINGLFRIEKLG
jgi:RNA 3'-phosphate cyclase